MTQHDDDQLDARLRAADPATSLPEADPARVARLKACARAGST